MLAEKLISCFISCIYHANNVTSIDHPRYGESYYVTCSAELFRNCIKTESYWSEQSVCASLLFLCQRLFLWSLSLSKNYMFSISFIFSIFHRKYLVQMTKTLQNRDRLNRLKIYFHYFILYFPKWNTFTEDIICLTMYDGQTDKYEHTWPLPIKFPCCYSSLTNSWRKTIVCCACERG
jgi:hypothetical protein